MKSKLNKAGYSLDLATNLWSCPGYNGIAYSDGDEVEERIAGIVANVKDLTVSSSELRNYCTDWPSLYHLNGSRANIVRPFREMLAGTDVLEIGAGCGSITRFLGECGANVLALEGSYRRAGIARSRTRDLSNVLVTADKFDKFEFDGPFDFVILVGVLEYANLFVKADNPPGAMMKRVTSLLKPTGKAIIAIENQLGLKYFCGAPEDHLGIPMYGIEDRYTSSQPQTFGRAALERLLNDSGFAHVEFLAPFPDYKLPVSIVTEGGLKSEDFDAAPFAWQSTILDPQLAPYYGFSLEAAWPTVFKNGLALDLANSFLIVASLRREQLIDKDILAYHYSTSRRPLYCKETVFRRKAPSHIDIAYTRLGDTTEDFDKECAGPLEFVCPDHDVYCSGTELSLQFVRLVTRDGWTIDEVSDFMKSYVGMIERMASEQGIHTGFLSPDTVFPGTFFDAIPQNIIVRADGTYSIIDKEWKALFFIEPGYLLFRALFVSISSVVGFGRRGGETIAMTRGAFCKTVFAALGMMKTDEDFTRYMTVERRIQEQVGGPLKSQWEWYHWAALSLPARNIGCLVEEQTRRIAQLEDAIAGKNQNIATLEQTITEQDTTIGQIRSSLTWRLSNPLRAVVGVCMKIRRRQPYKA
jgi:SAM-dependent methyltransferase/uncharacterized coiled-coil protein SlyX